MSCRARRLRVLHAVGALILAWAVVPLAAAAQAGTTGASVGVPTFGGNAGRTGVHPGPGPAAAPTERWRFASEQTGLIYLNPPAVVDGVAYVSGRDRYLYALDATTGAERWRYDAPEGSTFYATPTVSDGVVYVGSGFVFHAVDAATGTARWTYEASSPIQDPALVIDGLVVAVGYNPSTLFVLDAATGEERWTTLTCPDATQVCVSQAAAAGDGTIYAYGGPNNRPYLYAFDAASGTERWRVESGSLDDGPLAVANGFVYALSGLGVGAYDPATGEERWRVDEGWFLSSIAVTADTLYVGTSYLGTDPHPAVFAFDALTGDERWRTGISSGDNINIYAGPVVAGDTVYVAGTHGDTPYGLTALDAATGAERWHLPLTYGFPFEGLVVVDWLIFVGGEPPDGEREGLLVLG